MLFVGEEKIEDKDRKKVAFNHKKPMFWIVLILIITCVSVVIYILTKPKQASVISDDPDDIPYESKVLYNNEELNRTICLSIDTKRFSVFNVPRFWANGLYKIKGDKLILESDEGDLVLVFEISDGKLIFDSDASEYDKRYYKFKEGEEFIRPTFDNGVYKDNAPNTGYDCVIADVDNDGKEERCFIVDGGASGPLSYAIAVMESGNIEVYSVFYPEYEEWSLDTDKDGKVIVKAKSTYIDSEDKKTLMYEIIVKDGNIVLSGEEDTREGEESTPPISYPF